MKVLRSFTGCLLAIAPLALGLVAGALTIRALRAMFDPIFTSVTAFCVFGLTFMALYLLRKRMMK